jgi:exodeoxyribonuclease-5
MDNPFPAIKIVTDGDAVQRVTKVGFENALTEYLPEIFAGQSKVIAWRNVTVDAYNISIRKRIFPTDWQTLWLPTDKVVATAPLQDLEENTFMRTDEEAEILQTAIGHHPLHRDIEIWNILAKLDNGTKVTLRVPTETGAFNLNNKLEDLSLRAKKGERRLWRDFWRMKDSFHAIRHSYALTTHRSQGSSYTRVFIDLDDIMRNKEKSEAFRSLYVAVTRAREGVYFV